ncbi:RHS repeat domain-containing protein [Salidesulfovibrio onnuriiensis]|uniref:RHS repeat domain-containing protein n=1 Tax=Salidesulfovibrio onnuriiensis TaxID=2583823 RepID=UPI0011C9EBD6|nr:RHS repeat-associated core domain-containing protein [Salidesulfovibrio onnuriiensis]
MTLEYRHGDTRPWIRYEDGTYEPVRLDDNLQNKRRGPGIPDWWLVDMPRRWTPEGNGYPFSDNHPSGPLTARRDAAALPELRLAKDEEGRIIRRTLSVRGLPREYEYAYDEQGRITEVSCNGSNREWYCYDARGRRAGDMLPAENNVKRSFEYNGDNRLLRAGKFWYEHDAYGFRSTRTDAAGRTRYLYAPSYRLLRVDLPQGTRVEYEYDDDDMPKSKRVNGMRVAEYRWLDMDRLDSFHHAGLDFSLLYHGDERLPYAMAGDAGVMYLRYDQAGSLLSVAGTNGAVVKYIEYDTFGNILKDTNPALHIPLGFAGGLQDPHTGLVRFGWRHYDPETGRWTARDPMSPAGRDPYFYQYGFHDPLAGKGSAPKESSPPVPCPRR